MVNFCRVGQNYTVTLAFSCNTAFTTDLATTNISNSARVQIDVITMYPCCANYKLD